MFLPLEHFHVTHKSLFLGFALIVTDHELLVFFSRPIMTCGCVGYVAITVPHWDRRRQHGLFYPGRCPSQYRLLVGLTHSSCFGPHYLQALSIGLAGYFVARSASDLSMFLTGNRTGGLRIQKHVVKATSYTTRPSRSNY